MKRLQILYGPGGRDVEMWVMNDGPDPEFDELAARLSPSYFSWESCLTPLPENQARSICAAFNDVVGHVPDEDRVLTLSFLVSFSDLSEMDQNTVIYASKWALGED